MIAPEIVARLAADVPFAVHGTAYIECTLCDAWEQVLNPKPLYMEGCLDALYDRLQELDRHDPECPWRLAREYMGGL